MSSDEDVDLPLSDRLARTERKQLQAIEREAEAKEIDNSCPICLDKLENEYANVDACGHRFHLQCIKNWSVVQNTCPLCNARFVSIVTHAISLADAQVGSVKVVDKYQTDKSFGGDVAREYIAAGTAYARQLREEARRKLVEASQQKASAKPPRKRPARSSCEPRVEPPLGISHSELSPIWSVSAFPSVSVPIHHLTARQIAVKRIALQEAKGGVFLEPLPVKRKGRSRQEMEPSEDIQENSTIENSLWRSEGNGLKRENNDNQGDAGNDWEEKRMKSAKNLDSTVKFVKSQEQKVRQESETSTQVREVTEEQGIKWIRSKITGKWIRARVSSISPSSISATPLPSLLNKNAREVQITPEHCKQSAEAVEIEARILSFQSRISNFKRDAALNAPRSKLTIDSLRTEPQILAQQASTQLLDQFKKGGDCPENALRQASVEATKDCGFTISSEDDSPTDSLICPVRVGFSDESPHSASDAKIDQSSGLSSSHSLLLTSDHRIFETGHLENSTSLPTLTRVSKSCPLQKPISSMPPRKCKSSKMFALMMDENDVTAKSSTAKPIKPLKGSPLIKSHLLRNAKKVLGDCTNLGRATQSSP